MAVDDTGEPTDTEPPSDVDGDGVSAADGDCDDDGKDNDCDGEVDLPEPGICDGYTVGTSVGECGEGFPLQATSGAWEALWDYHGDVILLDLSAGW